MLIFEKITTLPEFTAPGGFKGSQAPCSILMEDDVMRVYFSSRDQLKRSQPFFMDLDISENPPRVINVWQEPLLPLGEDYEFDSDGVMISQVIKTNFAPIVWYVGWNDGNDQIRYMTAIGKGYFDGITGKWIKEDRYNPILDRGYGSPCGTSMPFYHDDNLYFMSYKRWIQTYEGSLEGESGLWEPEYGLSMVFKNEDRVGLSLSDTYDLNLKKPGESLARPIVWTDGNTSKMLFSYRGEKDYRFDRTQSYKIGYAESEFRCHNWKRDDSQVKILGGEDDLMQAYPYLERNTKYGTFLLYNSDFTSPLVLCKQVEG